MTSDEAFELFLKTRDPEIVLKELSRGTDLRKELFSSAEHREMLKRHKKHSSAYYEPKTYRPALLDSHEEAKPERKRTQKRKSSEWRSKITPEQLAYARRLVQQLRNEGKI